MDLVDTINGPAMVIPTSIYAEAFIERDKYKRNSISFYAIPYEFLVRDKWEDLDLQRSRAAADSIEDTLLKYERSSQQQRKQMLETIKHYAFPQPEQNGNDTDTSDESSNEEIEDTDAEEEEKEEEEDDEEITADILLKAYNTRGSSRSRHVDDL